MGDNNRKKFLTIFVKGYGRPKYFHRRTLRPFDKLVATHPDAVCKGDTMPYTSLNGNMYSYLSKDGFLALRLPPGAREDFLIKYNTTLVVAYGIIQKEYATVPDTLLMKVDEFKPYFALSYQYADTLKPKAPKHKNS